ncbi:hypothetical protein [Hyalangium gracile]|uniref:hypothetical protein n=1 Tax=Hyalangium gracile TaxID=394092 RepID=UPI001CD0321A|nr:hypothetical protein [Hyalangium gracile]
MTAGRTSAAVRFWDALAITAAASAAALLAPSPSLAATPGERTQALTPLEQELIVTPDTEPSEVRQPVAGYLRRTEDGWSLDMLPGPVARTGPLPVLTTTADSAPEHAPSLSIYPYAPFFRIDF